MMEMTARLNLPLLAVAQAAKEMTVNEALTALEIAVQPVVESEIAAPPGSPVPGQCWLVASGASGAFMGHVGAIACWTVGGWRFVAPFEGMTVWRRDAGTVTRRGTSAWNDGAAVTTPTGGSTVDAEARASIVAILARLRGGGLIAA